jgi:hypothetical protein
LASPKTVCELRFAEAQVGGDDDAGAFVKFAQQVEEQRAAGGAERQIAQRIQEDEVEWTSRLAICPALPWAFSCSRALTSSTLEKKRTRFR